MKRILILDDSLTICLMLKSWLVKENYQVETSTSVADAKAKVKSEMFDLILSDIRMPEDDGLSFLSWVKRYDSDILVIMMTSFADIETAVESMKSGAIDYIAKPIAPEVLSKKIKEAFNKHEAEHSSQRIANAFFFPPGDHNRKLAQKIDQIVQSNQHALIIGDAGTGKASVAKYIYEKGVRKSNSFVIMDCSEDLSLLQDNEMPEDEECGHSIICQYLLKANNGLLFVRKIHELSPALQRDLVEAVLRLKEEKRSTQIIAGTHLKKGELENILCPQLCELLDGNCIDLSPLKGRGKDILFFAEFFLKFANLELDKDIAGFHPLVAEKLIEYDWPGNIQELKNTVLKAALLTKDNEMSADIIPMLFEDKLNRSEDTSDLDSFKKENWEKKKIMEALKHAEGNKTLAAKILDIDRKTLYNKIKLYQIY